MSTGDSGRLAAAAPGNSRRRSSGDSSQQGSKAGGTRHGDQCFIFCFPFFNNSANFFLK